MRIKSGHGYTILQSSVHDISLVSFNELICMFATNSHIDRNSVLNTLRIKAAWLLSDDFISKAEPGCCSQPVPVSIREQNTDKCSETTQSPASALNLLAQSAVLMLCQGHPSALRSHSQRVCQAPLGWVQLLIPKKLGWSHTGDLWVRGTEAYEQCPEASHALTCASAMLLAAKFVFWKDKSIK